MNWDELTAFFDKSTVPKIFTIRTSWIAWSFCRHPHNPGRRLRPDNTANWRARKTTIDLEDLLKEFSKASIEVSKKCCIFFSKNQNFFSEVSFCIELFGFDTIKVTNCISEYKSDLRKHNHIN